MGGAHSAEARGSRATRTFDHGEHRVGLVQGDGETQSLAVLLLLQQVGQLLLPRHTDTQTRLARCLFPET